MSWNETPRTKPGQKATGCKRAFISFFDKSTQPSSPVPEFNTFGGRYRRFQTQTYFLGTKPGTNVLYQGNAAIEYEFNDLSDTGEEDESLDTEYVALIIHKLRVPAHEASPVSRLGDPPVDIPEAGMEGLQIWCALPGEEVRQ